MHCFFRTDEGSEPLILLAESSLKLGMSHARLSGPELIMVALEEFQFVENWGQVQCCWLVHCFFSAGEGSKPVKVAGRKGFGASGSALLF